MSVNYNGANKLLKESFREGPSENNSFIFDMALAIEKYLLSLI